MISTIVSEVLNFVRETVVLTISGCVSLLAISGFFYGLTFILVKHVKHFRSNKKSSDFNSKEEEITKKQTSELDCEVDRLKCSRSDKTLKSLRQQSFTVASNNFVSNSEKDGEVREFLEHLISTLISEDLDDVPLTPLSNDERYEAVITEYHSKLSSVLSVLSTSLHSTRSEPFDESAKPSNLYIQLKLIINEISEKASSLPTLSDYDDDSKSSSIESKLESQSYEDILATAVLNKIILKCQNGKEPYAFTDDVDLNVTSDFEYRFNNWNSSPKQRISLMVEEHIEEITTRYQSSEDENEPVIECLQSFNLNMGHRAQFPELGKDIVDGYDSCDEDNVTEIVSNVDSWEDNWLFQKKKKDKVKTTVAQVSVPMLVPNPSEKYRALIGDVDVDETSDLSECSDSIIEELTEFDGRFCVSSCNNLDTGSLKGKIYEDSENYHADHDQDSSGVTSISRDISDIYSFSSLSPCHSEEDCSSWNGISEAKNRNIFLNQDDSGEGSLETQPETEFSVNEFENSCDNEFKIRNITSTELKSRKSIVELNSDAKADSLIKSSPNEELAQPPRPGTIAEREHLKWQQAVPLPNNPYSKENIEKRNRDNLYSRCLSNNSSLSDQIEPASDRYEMGDSVLRADIKKYERDYYINTKPINGTKETLNDNGVNTKLSQTEDDNAVHNGFTKITPKVENPAKKTNLVRVLSWSERKQPEIDVKKRLPSVKELAKQFSAQPNFSEVKSTPISENQMVHSLTARSMSREFREGLKNNIGKTYNRNVLSNDGNEKTEESIQENGTTDKTKLDNAISFWENI